MLRVECESCKAPYQVDERRIPATGLKMRCPKCGHTFVVKAGAGEPVPPPDPHARPAPGSPAPAPQINRKMQATMLGVGSGISKPPPGGAGGPPTEEVTPSESEVGLPAARPIGKPPIKVPGAPATKASAIATQPAIPSAGPITPRSPGGPDADLPAVRDRGAAALPATRPNATRIGLPPPAVTRTGSRPDAGETDLPVAAPPRTTGAPGPKLSPPSGLDLDLPTARGNGTVGARSPAPAPAATAAAPPKPAPAAPKPMEFGELDLPSLGGAESNLPSVSGGNNLPSVATGNLPTAATNNLPAVANALPAVAGALPAVANALPAVANALPTVANALPAVSNALPAVADVLPAPGQVLPVPSGGPVKTQPLTPQMPPPAKPDSAPPEFADFGELDLGGPSAPPGPPPAPKPVPSPKVTAQGLGAISDPPPLENLEFASLPPTTSPQQPPAPRPPPPAATPAQDLGFGEVDLGAADPAAPSLEAEAMLPTASADAPPASRPEGDEQALPTAQKRTREAKPVKSKRGGRIFLGLLAVLLLGGGALELTPHGAFARNTILDSVNASSYAARADEVAATTRRKMASDLFTDARAAADQAAAAKSEMPRARALGTYAALVEYETQLRFGGASDRIPRVKQWLVETEPHPDTKFLNVALAAQQAVSGDLDKARKGLEAASKRDVGDGVQEEIALMRGEVELKAKEGKAALEAFARAEKISKTARTEFGKARALVLTRDLDLAKKSLDETLKLSPKHVEARITRATLVWEQAKDETAALADLTAVLDGEAKNSASDLAKAQAQALRGWIHVGRGRSAEARAAFDGALKHDARNVYALVGQGEVFFNEGRFTEALTRFETAAQTDPTSVLAVVSAAKAKLSLERLQDAKSQLAAMRAKFPKDWRVAHWLGKAEHALGNKPSAEKELTAAIELLDVKDPDAVQPYVALSTLYAAQGKSKEADAKLAEAKAKLPDTSSLRRALGEMAAQRGEYEQAGQHFRAALEKDPNDLSTRFRLGVMLRRMRKITEAGAELDKVVAVDKDYPGLALERGLLYEEAGDIDKALEQFQGALAKAPDDPDLMLRVGAAYAAIGRPGDAVPILRKVMEKRPQSAEANHFLGRALFLQGNAAQAEAMRFLKRAVELDPNRAEYHLYVGWAANNAIPAQLGVARDAIEKALTLDKLLADAYWQRGVLGRKEGAVDDAIKDLKRALELKPSRVDAHAALAECYEDKNELGTAMAEWQKAIAADNTKPAWRYRFGKLHFDRGNMGEAGKHVIFAADEGEKMDPKPGWLPSAEFMSGEILRKAGKKQEAIDRYKRFLEIAPTNSPDRKDANAALTDLGANPRR